MNTIMEALLNTLMGMGTVFVVLIFMALIINLFKFVPGFVQGFANRGKKEEPAAAPAPQRPVLVEEEEEEEELVDDGELVAVITAAIMATYASGPVSADKLVVRSIKRAKTRRR